MSDDSQRPIIVKRIKKTAHGHHGGAWKIAYADFVTAMMAFFLLMWLLGSTTKGDLQGISEYFQTPLKVALLGGSGAGEATSVIKGGGTDLLRAEGQQKKGESATGRKIEDIESAEQALARRDKQALKELKTKIEGVIAASPVLSQFRNQLLIDITTEGLRIQIVDEHNRPMFAIGSAQLQPYTRDILREIGKVLNDVPNRISLSGHTDATPYSGGAERLQQLGAVCGPRQCGATRAPRRRHARHAHRPRRGAFVVGAARRQRSLQSGEPAREHHRDEQESRGGRCTGRRNDRGRRARRCREGTGRCHFNQSVARAPIYRHSRPDRFLRC